VELTVRFSRKKLVRALTAVAAVLAFANLAHHASQRLWGDILAGLGWRFDLAADISVPTWFSSLLLGLAAALLWQLAPLAPARGIGHAGQWKALAAILAVLSVDEVAALHEWASTWLPPISDSGFLYYRWVVLAGLFVVLAGGVFASFVAQLPTHTRALLLLAAAVFVAGALGMEMVAGWIESRHGAEVATYALVTTIEESAEMAGVIIAIHALLELTECMLSEESSDRAAVH
jgi:hypothetical protein